MCALPYVLGKRGRIGWEISNLTTSSLEFGVWFTNTLEFLVDKVSAIYLSLLS